MKTLWSTLLIFFVSAAAAQQFKVTVSDQMRFDGDVPVKVADAYYSLEAEPKMQFGFTFKLNKVKFPVKLMKYDKGMQTVKEVSLSNGEKIYGPFRPVVKNFSDKPYLLYYLFSEEDERIKLMVAEINAADLSLKAPEEILSIEQKNVGLQQASKLLYNYKFEFSPSPDKSRWLALWSSGINNKLFFAVLDGNLKRIRTAEETVDGQREIAVKGGCVDNAGNVFISYVADKRANILSSGAGGKKMTQEVKLTDANPYEVFVLPSTNGTNIQVAGTYKGEKDFIVGVFSQTINPATFKMSSAVVTPFPAALVERFDNDGWASTKAKKYGLNEINLQPFLLPDGTVDLVGEFRSTQLGTRTSFDISGGILNVHFKKEGLVFARIPKARVSAGSTIGDSYSAVPTAAGIAIFYNDHADNIRKDIAASPNRSDNYKNAVLVAATIAADGTVKRDILIDLNREDYLPIAESLQQTSPTSILIPVRKIKGFGKVTDDFRWGTIDIN